MNVEGLTSLTTDHLKRLLKYVHEGSLGLPLTAHSIAAAGFQFRHHELMSALRGLDEAAIRAVRRTSDELTQRDFLAAAESFNVARRRVPSVESLAKKWLGGGDSDPPKSFA